MFDYQLYMKEYTLLTPTMLAETIIEMLQKRHYMQIMMYFVKEGKSFI